MAGAGRATPARPVAVAWAAVVYAGQRAASGLGLRSGGSRRLPESSRYVQIQIWAT
jgi:hypothetical protein